MSGLAIEDTRGRQGKAIRMLRHHEINAGKKSKFVVHNDNLVLCGI